MDSNLGEFAATTTACKKASMATAAKMQCAICEADGRRSKTRTRTRPAVKIFACKHGIRSAKQIFF